MLLFFIFNILFTFCHLNDLFASNLNIPAISLLYHNKVIYVEKIKLKHSPFTVSIVLGFAPLALFGFPKGKTMESLLATLQKGKRDRGL